ncbi:MAG TPA: hypothetical protein VIX39_03135 [Actinomycetota bacterium]
MSYDPQAPTSVPPDHPTERERAMKATVVGVGLGLFLWLVSRRRSA